MYPLILSAVPLMNNMEKRFSCVFKTSPVFPLFVAVVVVSVLIMYCLFWLLLILVYTYCFFPFHNNFCNFQTQVCMAFDFLISGFAFVLLFLRLIFPMSANLFLFFFCFCWLVLVSLIRQFSFTLWNIFTLESFHTFKICVLFILKFWLLCVFDFSS